MSGYNNNPDISKFQGIFYRAASVGSQVVKGVAVGGQAALDILNANTSIASFLSSPDTQGASSDEEIFSDEVSLISLIELNS